MDGSCNKSLTHFRCREIHSFRLEFGFSVTWHLVHLVPFDVTIVFDEQLIQVQQHTCEKHIDSKQFPEKNAHLSHV